MSEQSSAIHIETISSPEQLRMLDYYEDRAEIEVPSHSLQSMPFELNSEADQDAYWKAVDRVRRTGYSNSEAIVLRPTDDGKWVVDDEHAVRFAAAKQVAGEFFTNLLSNKVSMVRFSLYGTSKDGKHKAPRFDFGGGD